MRVKDILTNKGQTIHSIKPNDKLSNAMIMMSENRVGSLMVLDPDIKGIITERDLLRCYQLPGRPDEKDVADFMTPAENLIVAAPTDSVQYAMAMMTEHRIKHIPVIDEGHLVGLISIGDAVKAMLDQTAQETKRLQAYITGSYPEE